MTALAVLWGFLRTPFGAGVVAILAALIAIGVVSKRAEHRGAADAAAKIEQKQRRSLDEARSGIDDVRRCLESGRVWDGSRGACAGRLRRDGP